MTDGKCVLILTADAGFGHRSAANAVAAALRELYGDDCAVEIVNPLEDDRVPAFLRHSQADYDRIVRDMPDLYKFGYEASDALVPSVMVESALTVMLFEAMDDLVRRHQPDAIVTTYPLYQSPLSAVYTIRRRRIPLLTVVTDLATVHRLWFHEIADLCLVPTPEVQDLARSHGLPANKVRIIGIPVHPDLARENRDPAVIRAELGWRSDLTTVLAVGGRRVGYLIDVLTVLNHSGLPLQLVIVAGGDDELYHQLEGIEWHTVVHLHNFVRNMPTLMHAADFIVCKAGGLIVTEALACGLPLLLIDVLPGQETGNANYVLEGGAGELAQDPVAALEIVYHWLAGDRALLRERAQSAQRLGRPQAAYEIAEQVWAAAKRGSPERADRPIAVQSKLIALLNRFGIPVERKASYDQRRL
jgi:1,2-diacylglycerol 3-beta-galactosyltransferase